MADSSNLTKTSSLQGMSMAELLKKAKTSVVTLHKSDIVKGVVTKLTSAEILVDVNAKTEAVVLEKDKRILRSLLSTLKVGDTVSVSVLNTESDMGYPVVSLRRYIDDMLWKNIEDKQKKQEPLQISVKEATKGGYLVETETGFSGFLPNSQVSSIAAAKEETGEGMRSSVSQELVGKKVEAYVLEQNRPAHKIIFSQKPVLTHDQFREAVKNLKEGQKVTAVVTHVASFGAFAAIPVAIGDQERTVDGLIHISEISWEKVEDVQSVFTIGQTIEAIVIGFDRDGKRVDLSIRRLIQDPFEAILKKYAVDQKVTGTIEKILNTGVLVTIKDNEAATGTIEGLIRKEKIPPTVTYNEGAAVIATVSEIDTKRHRFILVPVLKEKPIGYR